MVSLEECFLD